MKCENWTTTSGELLQVQYYCVDFHYSPITTLDHPTYVCSEVEYINAQVNSELDHSGSETIRFKH